MADSHQDIWVRWLLHRRHGGDPLRLQAALAFLYPIRDAVLDHANLRENQTLIDVGCGDGLIAFGALERVKTSKVIFSDISQDLLDHTRTLAEQMQVMSRCEFVRAPADNLAPIPDSSVDVVTTRSVLIYVADKQKAFDEFLRVLVPGGRISLFEPINRFAYPEPPHLFDGYDISSVREIADKVKQVYLKIQPPDSDPMTNFDERDLVSHAERAGFRDIHLELQVAVQSPRDNDWNAFLRTAGNPRIPTLDEAMNQVLAPSEQERFSAHLRPLVEGRKGTARSACAYLWAIKE